VEHVEDELFKELRRLFHDAIEQLRRERRP
jgi:hypothetical protein